MNLKLLLRVSFIDLLNKHKQQELWNSFQDIGYPHWISLLKFSDISKKFE